MVASDATLQGPCGSRQHDHVRNTMYIHKFKIQTKDLSSFNIYSSLVNKPYFLKGSQDSAAQVPTVYACATLCC